MERLTCVRSYAYIAGTGHCASRHDDNTDSSIQPDRANGIYCHYCFLRDYMPAPANSPPSTTAGHSIQSLGYNAPAESQIWTLNCQRDLTAQWVNTDACEHVYLPDRIRDLGSVSFSCLMHTAVHPTTPFYDSAIDAFMIGGDLNKFTQTFPNEGITALVRAWAVQIACFQCSPCVNLTARKTI